MKNKDYKHTLRALQIELVKLQNHIIKHGDKILVIFEGRDSAGKDGAIKRIIQHLSPRETRAVALGAPTDRERGSWYFQRFVPHLPGPGEFVLFNRSWYNRAGVERVMGFCTKHEYQQFMAAVPEFELMLIGSGVRLLKYYLDISRAEQKRRLADRRRDPLKQWKESPIDDQALSHWKDYSRARDEMFERTHTRHAPWTVVRAEDKRLARINVIRDLLTRNDYASKKGGLIRVDRRVVFHYDPSHIKSGLIAR